MNSEFQKQAIINDQMNIFKKQQVSQNKLNKKYF